MRVLDLFSGIGGMTIGLERTGGFHTVAFCEIEKFPRTVLAKHWPTIPCFDDVTKLNTADIGCHIDVITGGFPCQDISVAGKQKGIGNETRSGLFSEIIRLSSEIRPRFIIMENVAALLSGPDRSGGWFGTVLASLAKIGYDAEWHVISAASRGAPHLRERVWIIAYPQCEGLQRPIIQWNSIRGFKKATHATFGNEIVLVGSGWPELKTYLRMGHGISRESHAVKSLGNALVPAIPELIGNAILESLAI